MAQMATRKDEDPLSEGVKWTVKLRYRIKYETMRMTSHVRCQQDDWGDFCIHTRYCPASSSPGISLVTFALFLLQIPEMKTSRADCRFIRGTWKRPSQSLWYIARDLPSQILSLSNLSNTFERPALGGACVGCAKSRRTDIPIRLFTTVISFTISILYGIVLRWDLFDSPQF